MSFFKKMMLVNRKMERDNWTENSCEKNLSNDESINATQRIFLFFPSSTPPPILTVF
jgi:hypothetical protein